MPIYQSVSQSRSYWYWMPLCINRGGAGGGGGGVIVNIHITWVGGSFGASKEKIILK